MPLWEILFWLSVLLVAYTYVFYPLGLGLVASLARLLRPPKPMKDPEDWPAVTILIPAYKEADSVVPKMEALRRLDYPKEKLQILWVISTYEGDDSLDATLHALKQYPEADYILVPREGKAAAMNRVRPYIQTPLTLISDANALPAPSSLKAAIREMLRPPEAGAVGGFRYLLKEGSLPTETAEISYLRWENLLRKWESFFGKTLGLGGEFFLIKTEYWPEIRHAGAADDIYMTLHLVLRGIPVRYTDQAITYETPSLDIRTEFVRKIRVAYSALNSISACVGWRDILRQPLFFFFFLLSHKLFRYFIVLPALGILLVSSAIGMLQGRTLYSFLFWGQVLAWIEAVVFLYMPYQRIPAILRVPGYFILAHIAQFIGLWRFLRKESVVQVWQRVQRAPLQTVEP